MKKIIMTIAATLVSSVAFATNPPVVPSVSAISASAVICDKIVTSTSSTGVGASTSNAGMSSGATVVVNAVSGGIQGGTSVYNSGFANNASTGTGNGSASAVGVSTGAVAASNVTKNDLGTVKLSGATTGSADATVTAGKNQQGIAVGATATTFTANGAITKTNGVVKVEVTDSKAAQSVSTTSGTGSVANAGGSVAVNGSAFAANGKVIPVKTCVVGHDVNGQPTCR